MQEHDRGRFLSVMATVAAAFRVEPSEALLDGYWFALEDMTYEAVEKACKASVRSLRRMPVPAELRELCGELPMSAQAIVAWDAVFRAIREVGAYRSVDFGPAINAAIRSLGGWQHLCSLESEELAKWTRKDFEKAYLAYADRQVGDAGRYLPGIHEVENTAIGAPVPRPVRPLEGKRPDLKQIEGGKS